jgi:Ca2+-binding RTX toxin-like protein
MNRDSNQIGSTFETLEDRRLCSATVSGGVLRVQGTEGRDEVTVSEFVGSVKGTAVRFVRVTEKTNVSFGFFDYDVTHTTDFIKSGVSRLRINSLGGSDLINLDTGLGADVFAGAGSDVINSSNGNDNLFADLTMVQNSLGQDLGLQLVGAPGNDIVHGGAGSDFIKGGPGDDRLEGGSGSDVVMGEEGNDTIFARDGILNEVVDGGAGFDTAQVDEDLFGIPRDKLFSIDSITP